MTHDELMDAVDGVNGEHDRCCDQQPPKDVRIDGAPCTRAWGHDGDHISAHADGYVLAWWRAAELIVH
jgi:hypothetical protein